MKTAKSETKEQLVWRQKALQLFPGGVNSPVRAFRSVGGEPFFVAKASGARLKTEEGQKLIDYVQSWGALILGHAHPTVVEAIQKQAKRGTSYGACHRLEVELAERIRRAFPSMEKMRFTNSGSEAVMSAIRLARGATGRKLLVKIDGGYHGHVDSLLVKAGSGMATFGVPDSAGIPEELAQLTVSIPFNDVVAAESLFAAKRGQIAALIMEPVPANMGVVLPEPKYLQSLRDLTRQEEALLIFDEVVSGFRVGLGGAQELYKIRPDLTVLGKIIGGGLPVGAFGGAASVMDQLAPLGPVYQAGTLSGNPLAMAAGCAALDQLTQPSFYSHLEALAFRLETGIRDAIEKWGGAACLNRIGSMLTLFFTAGPVRHFTDAEKSDTARFAQFFQALLKRQIFIPPSQFEAWFVSAAHTLADIDQTIEAAGASLKD